MKSEQGFIAHFALAFQRISNRALPWLVLARAATGDIDCHRCYCGPWRDGGDGCLGRNALRRWVKS
jgi:hypothetical protein